MTINDFLKEAIEYEVTSKESNFYNLDITEKNELLCELSNLFQDNNPDISSLITQYIDDTELLTLPIDIKKEIINKLYEFECENDRSVIFITLVGSRCFGFSDSKSDYDIKFVYLENNTNAYMKLKKVSDNVSFSTVDEYKIEYTGFDVRKFLSLLYSSNPSILEWTKSDQLIFSTDDFNKIVEIVPQYVSFKKLMFHYSSMLKSDSKKITDENILTPKFYLHCIRNIMCLTYINIYNEIPPTNIFVLRQNALEKIDLVDDSLKYLFEDSVVEDLIHLKKYNLPITNKVNIINLNNSIEYSIKYFTDIAEKMDGISVTYEAIDSVFLSIVSSINIHD